MKKVLISFYAEMQYNQLFQKTLYSEKETQAVTNAIANAGLRVVETFEIFTYICAGRQLSNNLFPHLP